MRVHRSSASNLLKIFPWRWKDAGEAGEIFQTLAQFDFQRFQSRHKATQVFQYLASLIVLIGHSR